MIDFEAIAIAWLGEGSIARVSGRTPDSIAAAWVRVTLIAAAQAPAVPTLTHASALLQLECTAGATDGQPAARDLASAVADRLHMMPGDRAGGTISAVTDTTIRRQPDETIKPARERYIVEATVHGHARRA